MKRDRGIGEVPNAGRKVGAGVKPTGVFARIAAADRARIAGVSGGVKPTGVFARIAAAERKSGAKK